ncbi:MAG TPA: bifunctional (p)ppGpp synthetase/guanosine-3',5'-bis(diphosphate) 3'-pyrophosphohydrolase, partial [Gallionella sp.]|nr:bifunctional (p)ppGpp synthetase/guanosine-3',5'-bis(diphosphate) 3'-pyrophosphohydrolase [Gallionella sp.]
MVTTPKQSPSSGNIQSLLDSVSGTFAPAEIDLIRNACELAGPLYAGQVELTGTPLLQHALGAAAILAGMNMDHETLAAAILHAVPEYLDDWQEQIGERFGTGVKMLVTGISRVEQIEQFSEMAGLHKKNRDEAAQQVETLRKMFLAMVEDIRVVLIKLAERTQTMRNLSGASTELQQRIAQQTRSIFAPLANRLGVWQLKWELEDLSVRYLEPALYKQVAKLLDERRVDREQYIAAVVVQLRQALGQAGISAEVTGRPKHIYSIINKMKRKQLDFSELYDVRAVRILVGGAARRDEISDETADGYGAEMPPPASTRKFQPPANLADAGDSKVDGITGCYAALGLVHELWAPIESEFDDYIAHPKSNNYRSLHTAVIGPRGLPLEVQIRTREMHQYSELGVAAHWRYKEGVKSDIRFDEKIAWLRQILEWKEELADKGDLQEKFRNELFHDQVYVLTPLGKVIALSKGATPVEFAYTLHTDLGHRTRGAKVDGSIVPLNYKLQNGQRVEILTVKQGGPSRDWINPSLGFLQSPRIRAKVRAWFKSQNFDESVSQGRTQLDRELHRLGITSINQEKLAQRMHFNKLDDLLAAIGRNEVTQRRIAVAIQEELPAKVIALAKPKVFRPTNERTSQADITVGGVNNLMTRIAKCCNPAPGDAIVGYVTRDRGITIHREDCPFMLRLTESRRERMLTA